ncbi:MAG: TIGR03960 family B12-binding radical SAM protein [Endomicrobia bacterium]|nr:TIGR03960 family B12-binding radical SAM protein [Endomicrobiia bacterium]
MKQHIEKLLMQVTTPGQYINNEYNSDTLSIIPKWQNDKIVKICLCYPDKYVIGMSNLGIEILYKLLNSLDIVLCERVFVPELDMERLLQDNNIQIFSLETQRKLSEFDIIGFSLQHELCYTNIFTVLSLAKIPFKRSERKEKFPLIIAGGPCTVNPKVLSDYIDFFVLGEAEEVIVKIVEIIFKHKNGNDIKKEEVLNEVNKLPSVYVPSIEYDKKVIPAVVDINKSFYPEIPTVPVIRTTHLRLNIELTRGCAYNCYFCQAGYIHKPLRYRNKELVFHLIEEGLSSTGYDEVALTGFCVTNYPYLVEVMDFIHRRFKEQFVSISLPSVRLEDLTSEILERLSFPRKSTITLAPEAGSERLRKVINKNVTNNEIYNKISLLYKYGFRRIKLYFMIGLPTETNDDIIAIVNFVRQLKKFFPGLNLNITISIFVPKPHTPFEFSDMDNYDSLNKKLIFLLRNLRKELHIGSVKNKIYSAFVEALISRGDEKIGSLIESVWYAGARFDNWDENFDSEIWLSKIKEIGINIEEYLFKKTNLAKEFVWDNVQFKINKNKLYENYISSLQNVNIKNVEEGSVVVSQNKNEIKVGTLYNVSRKDEFLFTLRLRFSRRGKIKYISYLDELELIKRALRMALLPLCYTQGYNPHIKMSLAPPISVGYESNSEYVDVELFNKIDLNDTMVKLNRFLPAGLSLIGLKIFSSSLNRIPSLSSIVNLMEYIVRYNNEFSKTKLDEFLSLDDFNIQKRKITKYGEEKVEIINLRDLIKTIELIDKHTVRMLLRFGPGKTLKPEIILSKIFDISENEYYQFEILRENLYVESNNSNIITLM